MKLYRDGIIQNWYGIKIKTKKILIQLNDREVDEEGSKIEKRFIIIFNFNYYIEFY